MLLILAAKVGKNLNGTNVNPKLTLLLSAFSYQQSGGLLSAVKL